MVLIARLHVKWKIVFSLSSFLRHATSVRLLAYVFISIKLKKRHWHGRRIKKVSIKRIVKQKTFENAENRTLCLALGKFIKSITIMQKIRTILIYISGESTVSLSLQFYSEIS